MAGGYSGCSFSTRSTNEAAWLAEPITTEIAPAGPGGEFLTRPELRLFATYAGWNDNAKGSVGGAAFADKTSGLTVGAQVEAWW